jgi:hypothetical protein
MHNMIIGIIICICCVANNWEIFSVCVSRFFWGGGWLVNSFKKSAERCMTEMDQGCQVIYFLKPKIPIWVNFRGSCAGWCWYILRPIGLFYCHMEYFVAKWYILWPNCIPILWPNGIFRGQMVYFVAKWYILWPNGIFCGQMIYFMVIWYIFPRFGMS